MQPGATHWRRIAAAAAIIVAVIVLYWPSVASLITAWQDTLRATYTHGWLIAAISGWLLWRARAALARPDEVSPTRLQIGARLLLLFLLTLAWLFSYRAGIQILQQLLLPLLMGAGLLAILGRNAARAALVPLAMLYFAIPVWDFLNFAALSSTTLAVRHMLGLFGVPAYIDGNVVQVPAGVFEIAGGCSGMHYIIVALAMGTLLGELRGDPWRMRARWWVIALVFAMVINWVRVFTVILAGHLSQMQHYLVRESHYGFGWALFSLVLVGLLIVDRRTPQRRAPAVPVTEPVVTSRPWPAGVVAAGLLLCLPLALNVLIDTRTDRAAAASWPDPHAPARDCTAAGADDLWQPRQNFADHQVRNSFTCEGVPVQTFTAWYLDQHQGKKLGGYDNRLQGDAEIVGSETVSSGPNEFAAMHLRQSGRDALLWSRFRVGDRAFTSAIRAQLWYSLSTLRSLRSPMSVVVALHAPCEPDCDRARDALLRFTQTDGSP